MSCHVCSLSGKISGLSMKLGQYWIQCFFTLSISFCHVRSALLYLRNPMRPCNLLQPTFITLMSLSFIFFWKLLDCKKYRSSDGSFGTNRKWLSPSCSVIRGIVSSISAIDLISLGSMWCAVPRSNGSLGMTLIWLFSREKNFVWPFKWCMDQITNVVPRLNWSLVTANIFLFILL